MNSHEFERVFGKNTRSEGCLVQPVKLFIRQAVFPSVTIKEFLASGLFSINPYTSKQSASKLN